MQDLKMESYLQFPESAVFYLKMDTTKKKCMCVCVCVCVCVCTCMLFCFVLFVFFVVLKHGIVRIFFLVVGL